MSPLRPALGFLHIRKPQPRSVRRVKCPFCRYGFEISQKALVIRCPGCTQPLRFQDLMIRGKEEHGDVATMGHVEITPASAMTGQVTCGELTIAGRFDGSAVVHGPIQLLSESLATGELTGRSLNVPHGATVQIHAVIQPHTAASERNPVANPNRSRLLPNARAEAKPV